MIELLKLVAEKRILLVVIYLTDQFPFLSKKSFSLVPYYDPASFIKHHLTREISEKLYSIMRISCIYGFNLA